MVLIDELKPTSGSGTVTFLKLAAIPGNLIPHNKSRAPIEFFDIEILLRL